MVSTALLSSKRGDWLTPPAFLGLVRQLGPIALDPCSAAESVVAAKIEWQRGDYLPTRDVDGLVASWRCALEGQPPGIVYVNPPYGRAVGAWIEKAVAESRPDNLGHTSCEILMLLPARCDTRWFPWSASGLCFWRGRLTFVGAEAPAPFPSVLAYWGPRTGRFREVFAPHGAIILRARRP
jgi:site-specific DNA-methyltransferase (adenine-specific)